MRIGRRRERDGRLRRPGGETRGQQHDDGERQPDDVAHRVESREHERHEAQAVEQAELDLGTEHRDERDRGEHEERRPCPKRRARPLGDVLVEGAVRRGALVVLEERGPVGRCERCHERRRTRARAGAAGRRSRRWRRAMPMATTQRSSTSAQPSSTLPCRLAHSASRGMTSRIRRSGVRASRASSQTSNAKSGIANDCARAVESTWISRTGVASAAIHIGVPPRLREAEIAMNRPPRQQHAVREVHERQAADGVEAIRREVREPLLVLPGMPGRERHQAVAVGQAVLHDVAPRDQVEPRVARDPAGCLERAGRARAGAAAARAAGWGSRGRWRARIPRTGGCREAPGRGHSQRRHRQVRRND